MEGITTNKSNYKFTVINTYKFVQIKNSDKNTYININLQIDEEIEKWQHKKQDQQNFEKLRQQSKDLSVQCKSLTLTNSRLKETIVRLEKERLGLESKLKVARCKYKNSAIC